MPLVCLHRNSVLFHVVVGRVLNVTVDQGLIPCPERGSLFSERLTGSTRIVLHHLVYVLHSRMRIPRETISRVKCYCEAQSAHRVI